MQSWFNYQCRLLYENVIQGLGVQPTPPPPPDLLLHVIKILQKEASKLTQNVRIIKNSGHHDGQTNFKCVRKKLRR